MNISLSIFLHDILKTRTRPKCSFNNGNFCWKTYNKSSVVVFVCTYPLSEKTKRQFSLILILDQPQYNLSCNTKAGNGKPWRWLCQSATFNTLVGLDGMLREGRDQHFVGYILVLKMWLILVIHVSSTILHLPAYNNSNCLRTYFDHDWD